MQGLDFGPGAAGYGNTVAFAKDTTALFGIARHLHRLKSDRRFGRANFGALNGDPGPKLGWIDKRGDIDRDHEGSVAAAMVGEEIGRGAGEPHAQQLGEDAETGTLVPSKGEQCTTVVEVI